VIYINIILQTDGKCYITLNITKYLHEINHAQDKIYIITIIRKRKRTTIQLE
jgi:hypothetical protein